MLSSVQKAYYAWDISHKRSVSDDGRFTGILSEARVDLNPHQVEAALFAFKSPLSKGAILADEVGLGKTIEAGIILSEMWAENKRNILIIVPASLRNQWNIELMEKFYLPSFILEKASFDEGKRIMGNSERCIFICSYNFAVSNAEYFKSMHWDLIVYDEAHKLRNVYKKSNVMANTLKVAFKDVKKVLLTATPLQNNLRELYGLISIIDPEFFSGIDTFTEQYNAVSTRDKAKYGELKSRISHMVHRTLRSQVQEYVNFTKRTAFVQEYNASDSEMELYAKVSNYLLREGTFGVPERQRPLLSLLVRKIMSSSSYALSFTLERFIQRLQVYKQTGNLTSAILCIAEDCDGINDEIDTKNYEESYNSVNDTIDDEIAELRTYCDLARSIQNETKAVKLVDALKLSFDKIEKIGGNKKALIFTESRKTQEYLYDYLQAHGYENKVICFNGTNNSKEAKDIYRLWQLKYAGTNRITGSSNIDRKQAIVDTFRDNAEILIATEAGAEGINLQFCSLVVNYDMPWNPQRIEQRIGRCHRYGQKNDVVVVNFVNNSNYADCRVYELLNNKFCLFDGVFGTSDEVLGSIDSGLDFEKKINLIYNNCRTEREIKAAFDELQKELEEIIQNRIECTKKSLLENFDEEVINKLKIRQCKDAERMDNYNKHLWQLAIEILRDYISSRDDSHKSFILKNAINGKIPMGKYSLNRHSENCLQLRYSHPLGEYIVSRALESSIADEEITFDLSSYPYRSKLLEQYRGKSGIAIIYRVNASNDYDSEEQLIACAKTDDDEILPSEFIFKLLELDCLESSDCLVDSADSKLKVVFRHELTQCQDKINDRTNEFVDYEINKYELWADDQLVPLRNEVMELSRNCDAIRRQIRKEHNASTKLQLKIAENDMAKSLKHKRMKLMSLEDEYSEKVDLMIEKLQKSLENTISYDIFFKFKWNVV